jgi:hypothetical protein
VKREAEEDSVEVGVSVIVMLEGRELLSERLTAIVSSHPWGGRGICKQLRL